MSETNELRALLLDYLDDLLDPAGRAQVEEMLARDPDVAEMLSRLHVLRSEFYKTQSIEPPSPEFRARVLVAARSDTVRAGIVFLRRITRYAAVFAAGVLTTFLFSPEPSAQPPGEAAPPDGVETVSHVSHVGYVSHVFAQIETAPVFRRRIR